MPLSAILIALAFLGSATIIEYFGTLGMSSDTHFHADSSGVLRLSVRCILLERFTIFTSASAVLMQPLGLGPVPAAEYPHSGAHEAPIVSGHHMVR